jgi:integrase/recombinase XerD
MLKSLTKPELDSLLAVARKHSETDYLMLLVTFNHGLRVSETLALTPENLVDGYLNVQRLKKSKRTIQPLLPNEAKLLRELAAQRGDGRLFPTYRRDFGRKMKRYGAEAGIPAFKCHPHALKHTTGRLAYMGGMGIPEIQKYLGHVNGANTMVYMEADEQEAANEFLKAIGA